MPRPTTLLAPAFLAAAVLGLIGTWYVALTSLPTERNYVGDVVASTPPWGSTETLLLTLAGLAFVLIEGRRQRVPYLWALAASVLVLGWAFAVPMFLFMRERLLNRRAVELREQLISNGVNLREPGRPAHHWFG